MKKHFFESVYFFKIAGQFLKSKKKKRIRKRAPVVKVHPAGTVGFVGCCQDCGFNIVFQTEENPTRNDVRTAVRKHVAETGHTVKIRSTKNTTYCPAGSPEPETGRAHNEETDNPAG